MELNVYPPVLFCRNHSRHRALGWLLAALFSQALLFSPAFAMPATHPISPSPLEETPCEDSRPLVFPGAQLIHVDAQEPRIFSISLQAMTSRKQRFLLVEARNLGAYENPPGLILLDSRCQELEPSGAFRPRRGRQILFAPQEQLFLRVDASTTGSDQVAELHLWSDLGAIPLPERHPGQEERVSTFSPISKSDTDENGDPIVPIPEDPMDEWDELRSGPCGDGQGFPSALKSDETGEDGNPVVPIPVDPMDEWDELRQGGPFGDPAPCRRRSPRWTEWPGVGMAGFMNGAWVFRSWCPSATSPSLLATFSCARPVVFSGAPASAQRADLRRILDDRPEMLALDLEESVFLSVDGAHDWAVFDATGKRLEKELGAETWLESGSYFLQIHSPDPTYALELSPAD